MGLLINDHNIYENDDGNSMMTNDNKSTGSVLNLNLSNTKDTFQFPQEFHQLLKL